MNNMISFLIFVCFVQHASTKKDQWLSEFPFNVTRVTRCPMDKEEWKLASERLQCKEREGYHCVPEYSLSSLLEFCYPLGNWIQFEKGNCIGLTLTGRLNSLKCSNFTYGCPNKTYYSNEIFDYPACLTVVLGCFSTDLICLEGRISNRKAENTCVNCSQKDQIPGNITCNNLQQSDTTSCHDIHAQYIFMALGIVFLCAVVVVCNKVPFIKCCSKSDIREDKQRSERKKSSPLTNASPGEMQSLLNSADADVDVGSISKDTSCKINMKTYTSVDRDKGIFVDFTVEDSELFILLKRQCKNGVYKGFNYLNDTRVKKRKKHKILCQRDETGCTLLHYAAQGGCIAILEEIMQTNTDIQIDVRCFQGQTVLDYSIKYQQKDMSEFLISKHKELLLDNSISTFQGIQPFHWVAWHGDLSMFSVLRQTDVNLKTETKNGLNILDIAVMRNKYDFCESMIENENMIQNVKFDDCGWNIAHYAAYANNVKVLQLLKSKNGSLITAKTKTMRTTLHIACEYGHLDVVKFITKHFEDLLHCTDNLKWNALHYASKGGNLQILQLLQEKGLLITSLTEEGKTVLHISCTHKQVEICKHVAHTFYNDLEKRWLIDKKTTIQSWMAAHYIGVEKKGDGSEEKIIDILLDYEANLSAKTRQGWSVLDIAIDHLNVCLVKHLLSDKRYRARLGISKESLLDCRKNTKDESILKILIDTWNEMTTN